MWKYKQIYDTRQKNDSILMKIGWDIMIFAKVVKTKYLYICLISPTKILKITNQILEVPEFQVYKFVAIVLVLESSNFVCKLQLSANFDFLKNHPQPWGGSPEEGIILTICYGRSN